MGYPTRMTQRKRTPPRIEAEKRYEERRAKQPVSFRLSEDEMALLDAKRGERSRSAVAQELMLKWLKGGKK